MEESKSEQNWYFEDLSSMRDAEMARELRRYCIQGYVLVNLPQGKNPCKGFPRYGSKGDSIMSLAAMMRHEGYMREDGRKEGQRRKAHLRKRGKGIALQGPRGWLLASSGFYSSRPWLRDR